MDLKENPNNQEQIPKLPIENTPDRKDLGSSKNVTKREGRVIEALPNAFFKVLLDDGSEIQGFLSGKMRLNSIKILPGDKVTLEMTPYDTKKGRIVYRLK